MISNKWINDVLMSADGCTTIHKSSDNNIVGKNSTHKISNNTMKRWTNTAVQQQYIAANNKTSQQKQA